MIREGFLIASLLLTSLNSAQAAMTFVSTTPDQWRLENYSGSSVVVWFSGSSCSSGQLTFAADATPAQISRFWAAVTVAKLTGQKMFLTYDNANAPTTCPIISFGLKES